MVRFPEYSNTSKYSVSYAEPCGSPGGMQTVPTVFWIRFKYQQSRSPEKQPTRPVGAVHQLSSTWFGGLALPRCFFFLSSSGLLLPLLQGTAEDCLGLAPGPNGHLCRHVSKLWGFCEPKKLEEKVISEVDGWWRVRKDMEQQASLGSLRCTVCISHSHLTKIDPGQAATSAAGALWRCGCHWLKPGTCSWNRSDAAEHRSLPNSTNLHCFTAPWAFERLECFTLVLSTVPLDIVWHDWTWHSHWTLVVLDPLWPFVWGFKSRKWRAVQSQQCSTLWQERAPWCPVLWTTIWQDLITDLFMFSVCSASLMNQLDSNGV